MRTEVDLHGYQVVQAIAIFVKHYNGRVKGGDLSPISVIHGYGSSGEGGSIKTALLKLLNASEEDLSFQQEVWNPGKTIVYPKNLLPSGAGIIAGEILEYCVVSRTESKILGKLRRFGGLKVKGALRMLVKQGSLVTVQKGTRKFYQIK
ncbi:MAG: hypothetical protein KAH54_03380 [Candidatus Sabulitectum sp.]|nr:hypothetical protein [Candidatus Sabulitectum sp.]